jgi:hypothetical protein
VDEAAWCDLPWPVEFMLRSAATDEVDDPGSERHQEGAKRGALCRNLEGGKDNTYINGIETRYIEDVGDVQWKQVWGETAK